MWGVDIVHLWLKVAPVDKVPALIYQHYIGSVLAQVLVLVVLSLIALSALGIQGEGDLLRNPSAG